VGEQVLGPILDKGAISKELTKRWSKYIFRTVSVEEDVCPVQKLEVLINWADNRQT